MSLTPAGRKLVRDCAPLLRDMERALLGSGGFAEASGVVRIGAGEIAAASCLPPFVAALKEEMPGVGLEIEIDLTANLIQQLLTGRSEEHTSELQSLMRISYAVFCLQTQTLNPRKQ